MRVCVVRFIDGSNVDWRVQEESWRAPGRLHAPGRWFQRRLRFESLLGVRYLAPVPPAWEELPPHELERLCTRATRRYRAA